MTIHPGVVGHGPQEVLWTAPASVDEGGVTLTGSHEQLFEQNREMRLSVFKNGSAVPEFFVDALPPIVDGVVLQRVNWGPMSVAVNPGDTLLLKFDASFDPPPSNAQSVTFFVWDMRITEQRHS